MPQKVKATLGVSVLYGDLSEQYDDNFTVLDMDGFVLYLPKTGQHAWTIEEVIEQ